MTNGGGGGHDEIEKSTGDERQRGPGEENHQDDGEEVEAELEGVIVKVRKASRTLVFLSVSASKVIAVGEHGEGGKEDSTMMVQAVLGHSDGWRQRCRPGGERLCCGATIRCSGRMEEQQGSHAMPSMIVRIMTVEASPHDTANSAGGIKQHREVEESAAEEAAARRWRGARGGGDENREDERKGVGEGQGSTGPVVGRKGPLCRQWWRGRCGEQAGGATGGSEGGGGDCEGRGEGEGEGEREEKGGEVARWGGEEVWGECGRRHFFLSEAEWQRFQVLKEERERMRERERDADDPHCEEEKAPKLRSDVLFVDWLVKTFGGAEGLKRAGGVVDVAGGRGDVAFRLVHRYGIPCTLVDPRPIRLTRSQSKAIRKSGSGSAAGGKQTGEGGEARLPRDGAGVGRGGRVATRRMQEEGTEMDQRTARAPSLPGGESGEERVDDGGSDGACTGGGHVVQVADGLVQIQQRFEAATILSEPLVSILPACALILGMHPDQATDSILEAALLHGKPFAVVPCCVFPSEFPHRFRPGGGRVETYSHLVEYLEAKGGGKQGGVESIYLPFRGRNKVVYRL